MLWDIKINTNTYIYVYINMIENIENDVLHYVKLTNPKPFANRFPKGWPTYRRQLINTRHQNPQELPCKID